MSQERGIQESKFNAHLDALRQQGLVDMKFFAGEVSEATTEDFFAEANHMIEVVLKGEGRDVDVDARMTTASC